MTWDESRSTHLWPTFARDFATLLSKSGVPRTKRLRGVGHSDDVQSIAIPELMLRIGGFETSLRPAHVLINETTAAGQRDPRQSRAGSARPGTNRHDRFRSMTLVLK